MSLHSGPTRLDVHLLGGDESVSAALRVSLGPAHSLTVSALDDLFEEARLAEAGHVFVQRGGDATVVLVEWAVERAPAINTIGYHLRRTAHVPLLALCTGPPTDAVAAIAAGADDALFLPVYPTLLQAKVMAYHRQRKAHTGPLDDAPHDVRSVGPLQLDRSAHRVCVNDDEIALTAREFALLDYLIEHRGSLCTREDILDQVWGLRFDTGTNMIDVYMHFLRRKLAPHGLDAIIKTVRGRGYRVDVPSEPG